MLSESAMIKRLITSRTQKFWRKRPKLPVRAARTPMRVNITVIPDTYTRALRKLWPWLLASELRKSDSVIVSIG